MEDIYKESHGEIDKNAKAAPMQSYTLERGRDCVQFRPQSNGMMLVTEKLDGAVTRRTVNVEAAREAYRAFLEIGYTKLNGK